MQYMLLIHSEEAGYESFSEERTGKLMADYGTFTEELEQSGKLVSAFRLKPTTESTTVRIRDKELLVTDGPFAETKEQFGGFYLMEADDLDEALRWAAKIPSALYGSIEVRPVWE